nr:zinc finger, CCHC-type [Tanacetum cinerariifolium]
MTEEEVQDMYQQAGLLLLNEEPTLFQEETKETQWMEAMHAEIDSIKKNQTWTLTRLPPNQKVIGLKWVFKLKRDASGMVTKHKVRLVAKGYVLQKGVDFEDAFSPMAQMESIWLLLALAAKENWIVHHLDVKSAFLNRKLKEDVYVTGNKYHQKDKIQAKLDKIEHEMESVEKSKVNQSQQVKVKDGAKQSEKTPLVDGTWGKIKSRDRLTWGQSWMDGYDELMTYLTQQTQVAKCLTEEAHKRRSQEPRIVV